MKERPTIFGAESVRAILEGRKTQTRRVVKQPIPDHFEDPHQLSTTGEWVVTENNPPHVLTNYPLRCPYGELGDLLWVRESYRIWESESFDAHTGEPLDPDIFTGRLRDVDNQEWLRSRPLEYRADSNDDPPWRSPLFMPRWASRLTLEVTGVRVERLQAISEGDALDEGIEAPRTGESDWGEPAEAVYEFARHWDAINGKRHPWESNCWVWVVSFERVAL